MGCIFFEKEKHPSVKRKGVRGNQGIVTVKGAEGFAL
jgi:hypothetical protein